MRILHILDSASRQCSPIALELIAAAIAHRETDPDHRVWLMGHMPDAWLGDMGHDPRVERLAAPYGRAMLAAVGAACKRSELGPVDGVQCWSLGAVALAHTLMPRTDKVWVLTTPPEARTMESLQKMLRRMPGLAAMLRVVSLSRVWQDALASLPGVGVEYVEPDTSAMTAGSDTASATSPDRPLVVAMISDDPTNTQGDARLGIMALGIACRVLQARRGSGSAAIEHELWVHPRQAFRREAEVLLERFGGTWRLVQEARVMRPWTLEGAVDVAMLPCGLGVAGWYAAKAGLAMAVEADADVGDGSIWKQSVLGVAGRQRDWAAALSRLLSERDDPGEGVALRKRLGESARRTAARTHEPDRRGQPWQNLWHGVRSSRTSFAQQES